MVVHRTRLDYWVDWLINIFMVLVCIAMVYPFVYALAYSLSNSTSVMTRSVILLPIDFTLENYDAVFKNPLIYNSFLISVARTVLGTSFTLLVTGLASYALSKKNLPGGRFLAFFFIVPMYVQGGLLPYYMVVHSLDLFNNFLIYILPSGFWAYNMLLMRTYFESLPADLEEAARLDGAGELSIFFRIIVPLSKPIFATIAIFAGVQQWNSWFDSMLFITNEKLWPMQTLLQKLLLESFSSSLQAQAQLALGNHTTSPESLKMAMVMVSTIPIIVIYPLFQSYFIKGIMIGAVKG